MELLTGLPTLSVQPGVAKVEVQRRSVRELKVLGKLNRKRVSRAFRTVGHQNVLYLVADVVAGSAVGAGVREALADAIEGCVTASLQRVDFEELLTAVRERNAVRRQAKVYPVNRVDVVGVNEVSTNFPAVQPVVGNKQMVEADVPALVAR